MARSFRHRLRVRYGECDLQGVVFNANYLAYFDVIITELWREAVGDYMAMVEEGADMVVAESRIRYISSAAFDDEIDFELVIARLGRTAISTRIVARVADRDVVHGEMRHVFIDPETKGKRDIPANIRAGLAPYAVAADGVEPEERVAAPNSNAAPHDGPGTEGRTGHARPAR